MKVQPIFFFNKVEIDYKEKGEVRIFRLRMHRKETFLEMSLRKFLIFFLNKVAEICKLDGRKN